ncbi:amino acid adenylation domain-containing protein, partial [Streptomyces sp. SID7499]|nr:amino acid adenylation domain-containing protein [Streptomyces sp. SID7499]
RGSAAGLRLEMDGNPAGHSASGLRRHGDLLLRLVDEAVREPDRPLGRIPLADRPVRRPSPVRRPAPDVVELIRARAADRPGATAVEQDRHCLTYAELLARADLLADGLRRRGAGPGRLVGVRLPRSPDAIVAVLAVLISGAGYVPLSPDAPDAYVEHLPRITVEDGLLLSGHADDAPPERSARGTDIAYVIHTSGSTGRPNGVMVPRAALAGFAGAAVERYGVTGNDRVLQFSSLQFDASVEEIFVALCSGAALVLRTAGMNESLDEFRRATARFGITVLDLPTAFWHELVAAGGRLPGSVHTVIIGGEGALPSRVAQWARLAPGIRLINTYGPTEATVVATAADLHPSASGRP